VQRNEIKQKLKKRKNRHKKIVVIVRVFLFFLGQRDKRHWDIHDNKRYLTTHDYRRAKTSIVREDIEVDMYGLSYFAQEPSSQDFDSDVTVCYLSERL
jgi:hypothetical protein